MHRRRRGGKLRRRSSYFPGVPQPDSSKPSVAFLIDRWDPSRGGAERAMAQLAEFLAAKGYRVLAVAEEHADGAPGEPVAIASSGLTRSRREKDRARKLAGAARSHGADVTIGCRHLYACDLYWPHGGAHAVTLSQIRREDGWPWKHFPDGPRHRTFIELERELLERGGARLVACVSRLVLSELAEHWPECRDRLVLVENGIELARFHPRERTVAGAALRAELGIPPDMPLIAFAARNPHLKGCDALEIALSELLSGGDTQWRCVMAGFEAWPIERPQGIDREHVVRRLDVDPVALWSAADLCVHPTWRDTFGLGIVEALACGTPVITTRFAGASAVVDSNAGTVLEEPEFVELHRAIAYWLERIRAGAIDRAAIRRCVEHLDIARCHETLERLVLQLANETPAAT